MPSLYWSRHRRRVVICRVLACTLTATLLCLVFLSSSVSAASVVPHTVELEDAQEWADESAHKLERRAVKNVKLDGEYPPIQTVQKPLKQEETIAEEQEVKTKEPKVLEEKEQERKEEEEKKKKKEQQRSNAKKSKPTASSQKDVDIIQAMEDISTLFPDELQLKGLLAPFSETGEAHVRDLGLRVRIFRKAFEAWEALHLVHHDGSVHQQDVIQKLRKSAPPSADLRKTIQTYDRFRSYVNRMAEHLFPWTSAYFQDHMSLHATLYSGGRGIVTTAGNDQAQFLLTSIPSFRKLGCQLPVEVLYLGDSDLDEEWRDKLEAMPGVITRDLSHMIDDVGWTLKGWAAKPFAMLMSSFREALFIDADALFFVNPETLFEDEGYLDTGALFFADRNLSPQNDKRAWLRKVLPKPISEQVQRTNRLWTGESVHMQDSGVVLVDKWRHFVAMLLTTRLNGPDRDANDRNGHRGVYDMVYGDKETFWLSWELAQDAEYSFHDSVAGNMGVLEVEAERESKALESATAPKATHPILQKEDLIRIRRLNPDFSPPGTDDKPDLPVTTGEPSKAPGLSTLCSPQLLHFDRQGKPLWWNGWIATSKFKEDHGKMQQFDVYVKEPKHVLKPGNKDRWDIRASNVVCLRSDDVTPFTDEEQQVLKMIRAIAEDNGPD